jgi:hypothetical protein
MTATFRPTPRELAALEHLFALSAGDSGGERRAGRLLCAWWNGDELGGFDLADLWLFDEQTRAAALVVIALVARAPQGTYADSIAGFGDRMRRLAERRAAELRPADDDESSP